MAIIDTLSQDLEDIQGIANAVRLKDDSRVTELMEMTVTGFQNRLETAQRHANEKTRNYQNLLQAYTAVNEKLKLAETQLKLEEKKLEQLENNEMSSVLLLEPQQRLKESIKNNQELLGAYKSATGVRFVFNAPMDVVAGCVAIKGKTPEESKLQPFHVMKSSRHIADEIWDEVSKAVEDITLKE